MSDPVDVEVTAEAAKRAKSELMELFRDLIPRNVGTTGASYGMHDMERGDRILAFLERRESGSLEVLRGIAPHWYEKLVRDYEADVKAMPLFAHTQTAESIREVQ